VQVAFEVMGVIAVITNCSLIALLPSVSEYSHGFTDVQVTMFFVAAEVRAMHPYHRPGCSGKGDLGLHKIPGNRS